MQIICYGNNFHKYPDGNLNSKSIYISSFEGNRGCLRFSSPDQICLVFYD